ncbi:alpha/beta hydrolase [Candidatus Woesearchaeota archaeon]|nr:alpha/beta hydrolase [Candidatus Woesearchaeota archaeon]
MKRGWKKILGFGLGTLLVSRLCFGDIDILSGTDGNGNAGNPGSSDQLTTFTSQYVSNESNAYIGVGAQDNPSWTLDRVGSIASQTITTTNTNDSWGKFYFDFNLPNNFSNPRIDLDIFLDDGGMVYLNDNSVAIIDLVQCPKSIAITNSSYFKAGTNTLKFYVANTGDGHYGIARERQSSGDAMYIEFDGKVSFDSSNSSAYPILLVPGYKLFSSSNPLESFGDLENILKEDGFNVESLDFSGSTYSDSIEALATAVGIKISDVKSMYNKSKVNVIAHSMGGLNTKAYISGMASNRSYGDDINYLMIFGTPSYGTAWANLISGFSDNEQTKEMSLGSRFLWDLHNAWNFNADNCVAVAGLLSSVEGDGIITVSGAYSEDSQIRYVSYGHTDLLNINDRNHQSYKIIKQFLDNGTLPEQSSITDVRNIVNGSIMLGVFDGSSLLDATCSYFYKNNDSNIFYLSDVLAKRMDYTLKKEGYEDLSAYSTLIAGKTIVENKYLNKISGGGDSGSSGSGGGGGGCFIATASYGSPMANEIKALSRFRDKYLLTNEIGKMFVKSYYEYGPGIANYIENKESIKRITRGILNPVVWFIDKI